MKLRTSNLWRCCAAAALAVWMACPARAVILDADEEQDVDIRQVDVRFDKPLAADMPSVIFDAYNLIEENPESAYNWVRLGDAYFLSEVPAKAASAYWRAARLQPDHPKALKNLGACFLRLNDHARAVQLFERLELRDPNDIEIKINLGAAYHAQRDYTKAERVYQQILDQDENNLKALYNLGVINALTDRLPESIDYYLKVYELNPDSPLSLLAAARSYARLNQPGPMYDLLQKASKQIPREKLALFLGHPAFEPYAKSPQFRNLLSAK